MKLLQAEVFYKGIVFGEGARWYKDQLWLSDMYGHKIYKFDAAGKAQVVADMGDRHPSGLAFLYDGSVLINSMKEKKVLRLEKGELKTHADFSNLIRGEINDMCMDSQGRVYVGNFGFDLFAGEAPRLTTLHLIDTDGSIRQVADGLNFPNGIAITVDGTTLIVAETFAHRLSAFDIKPDGSLTNQRVFAELGDRAPDGITVDVTGAVWVASFSTDAFIRVLDGGIVTDCVYVGPDKRAVCCTLGGEDGRTLFMLSAETTIEKLGKGESVGYVQTARVEVPGAGSP